jgi:hypothetical protein
MMGSFDWVPWSMVLHKNEHYRTSDAHVDERFRPAESDTAKLTRTLFRAMETVDAFNAGLDLGASTLSSSTAC